MNHAWLMRAKRWAQNPPSARRVALVVGVIAVCVALFALEATGHWPDWARVEKVGRAPRN